MSSKIVFALALVLICAAFTDRQEVIFDRKGNKIPDEEVNSSKVSWRLLKARGNAKYNGMGLIDFFGGNGCSGTFLDTGAGPDGPAYILSNGHCLGSKLMGPRETIVDRPVLNGLNFRFNYFAGAGRSIRRVPIKRIVYATMHRTDIAIFELDSTFGDLSRAGYHPYAVSASDPALGTAVEMIGIPQNGVKRASQFLRRSTCKLEASVNLREGDYEFFGAFRHKCSSVGGSSGSALISLATREIVAIHNTAVNDEAKFFSECAIDRPCEVRANGAIRTEFDVNYAQRVSDIPTCFDNSGVFDLKLEGCRLEAPQAKE